jgi:hypothetical protein
MSENFNKAKAVTKRKNWKCNTEIKIAHILVNVSQRRKNCTIFVTFLLKSFTPRISSEIC